MTKREFTATAPNGATYTFTASKAPAAVRFLECNDGGFELGGQGYIVSHHRTVNAASTSFLSPTYKLLLRPDSVVTEIREA